MYSFDSVGCEALIRHLRCCRLCKGLFALVYHLLPPGSFGDQQLHPVDALYFSAVSHVTGRRTVRVGQLWSRMPCDCSALPCQPSRTTAQVVHSTVGFGDIGPLTGGARLVVVCHILVVLLVVGGAFQAAADDKEDAEQKKPKEE